MRAISQIFPFIFISSNKIILFLFVIIAGCTHFGFRKDSTSSPNLNVERSYFSNGKIEYEAEFINGKLDGLSRVWTENGMLISESEYSNGQPHGIWRKYHPNGSLMYEVHYEYGKKHGDEKWFYESGQVKSDQKFKYGKPESEIIRFQSDGTLVY